MRVPYWLIAPLMFVPFGLLGCESGAAEASNRSSLTAEYQGDDWRDAEVQVFRVELRGHEVAHEPVHTRATAEAFAFLKGDKLTVGGGFRDLSSPLKNLVDDGHGDPDRHDDQVRHDDDQVRHDDDHRKHAAHVREEARLKDPGIHIHEGARGDDNDHLFELMAHVEDRHDTTARFSGHFTLTESEKTSLEDGHMYIDIKTEEHPLGEIRGQFERIDAHDHVEVFEAAMKEDGAHEHDAPKAHAVAYLLDDVLTMGGHFSDLSSGLRDSEVDPLKPGVHVKDDDRHEATEKLFELAGKAESDERRGSFSGSFEVGRDEVEKLRTERLHVEVVTKHHPDGEARDHLRPKEDHEHHVDRDHERDEHRDHRDDSGRDDHHGDHHDDRHAANGADRDW